MTMTATPLEARHSFLGIHFCRRCHKHTSARGTDITELMHRISDLCLKTASKPIDKVYGLLFLLPNDVRQGIIVDYSQEATYWTVYMQLAKQLMTCVGGLAVLSKAAADTRTSEIPSWCPDLSKESQWIAVPRERHQNSAESP